MLAPTVLLRQVTLLVADDEEALRLYMCRALQAAGYRVLTAQDGVSALSLLQQSRFPVQLVITDVCMPRMTGPELAARIATEQFPPPLLFVSGGHPYPDLPGPVLRKPFLPDDLTKTVDAMLSHQKPPALKLVPGDVALPRCSLRDPWRSAGLGAAQEIAEDLTLRNCPPRLYRLPLTAWTHRLPLTAYRFTFETHRNQSNRDLHSY